MKEQMLKLIGKRVELYIPEIKYTNIVQLVSADDAGMVFRRADAEVDLMLPWNHIFTVRPVDKE